MTTTDAGSGTRPQGTGIDENRVEEFGSELLAHYTSSMVSLMIDLGHRTGLFEAAAEGPATSEELASRAGLRERYVREWLGALVAARIVDYDPAAATYTIPPEHAAALTGRTSNNLAPMAQINTHLGSRLPQVAHAFRHGGGVPYSEFRPEFTDVMDAASRFAFDDLLVGEWLPVVPDVLDRLRRGAHVADIGCGTGHAVVVLAAAFPSSTFIGIDLSDDAIAQARTDASEHGVTNARFEVADAACWVSPEPLDVALSFDAIHDQADPRAVLERIHSGMAPDGRYVMVEPAASSRLEENVANPLAPWLYGVSTLHCLTVSLAEDGTGLGTAWGYQRARDLLIDVGFANVGVHDAPRDPTNSIYVATRP